MSELARPRGRSSRRSVVYAEAAKARQLHRGMAQVEPRYQTEEIELNALDPTNFEP